MAERLKIRPIKKEPDVKRGFSFRNGRILFMNKRNTVVVGKEDQCSCTAQAGND